MSHDAQLTALIINAGITLKPAGTGSRSQGPFVNNGTITRTGTTRPGPRQAPSPGRDSVGGGRAGGAGATGTGANGNTTDSSARPTRAPAAPAGPALPARPAPPRRTQPSCLSHPYPCLAGASAIFTTSQPIRVGAGGGGGGDDGTNAGGGGGGGGGVIPIFAWTVTNTGTMTAKAAPAATARPVTLAGRRRRRRPHRRVHPVAVRRRNYVVRRRCPGAKTGTGSNGNGGGIGTIPERRPRLRSIAMSKPVSRARRLSAR